MHFIEMQCKQLANELQWLINPPTLPILKGSFLNPLILHCGLLVSANYVSIYLADRIQWSYLSTCTSFQSESLVKSAGHISGWKSIASTDCKLRQRLVSTSIFSSVGSLITIELFYLIVKPYLYITLEYYHLHYYYCYYYYMPIEFDT